MFIKYLAPLAIGTLCAASLMQIIRPVVPRLLYNPSPSAPIGWYRLSPNHEAKRDDLVASYMPQKAALLADREQILPYGLPIIKTVWATSGDVICWQDGFVIAPSRPKISLHDRGGIGRNFSKNNGCITLNSDELFLVSTDVQASYDSRYFGPVKKEMLLGRVTYLGRFMNRSERRKAGHG